MNLQYLDSVFKQVYGGGLSPFITYSKALGALILVVVLGFNLYRSFSRTGQIFTERESDGFSPYELLRGLGLILMVIFSTQILDLFDNIMVDIETIALGSISNASESLTIDHFPTYEDMMGSVKDAYSSIKEDNLANIGKNLLKIVNYLNPMTWIGGSLAWVLEYVLMLVDIFVYPFFLTKRYFIMGIIKMMFPLLIAVSIFDKTRDYVTQVLKYYARVYLAIIPMIFASYAIDLLHFNMNSILETNTYAVGVMTVAAPLVRVASVIVAVLLKIRLFKDSFTIMEKLIP